MIAASEKSPRISAFETDSSLSKIGVPTHFLYAIESKATIRSSLPYYVQTGASVGEMSKRSNYGSLA